MIRTPINGGLLASCKCSCSAAPLFDRLLVRRYQQTTKNVEEVRYLRAAASDPKRKRLYCWGNAEAGALGELNVHGKQNKFPFTHKPFRKTFSLTHRLIDVSCGYGYTVYLTRKEGGHQVHGSGLNTDGQIGFQTVRGPLHPLRLVLNVVPIRVPLRSPKNTKVLKVAAGRAHSLVLTDAEGIFATGNNSFGQCGRRIVVDEDYVAFKELQRLEFADDERVVDIVCGQDHSLFLTDTGRVYSCGNGADGQTGLGHYRPVWQPTPVEGDIRNERIVKLSSAVDTVLALNDKGDVFGWGNSEYFQLPLDRSVQQMNTPTHLKQLAKLGRIKDVAASGSASMVLTDDGEVYVWGFGILGKGVDFKFSEIPSPIPRTLFGQSPFRPNVTVASLSCGLSNMAAITNFGSLYMWGKNDHGQLGLGHRNDQFYPMKVSVGGVVEKVSCGVDHTMALCKPFT